MLSQFKKLKIYSNSNYSKDRFAKTFGNNINLYHKILVLLNLSNIHDTTISNVCTITNKSIIQMNNGIIFKTKNNQNIENCYYYDDITIIDKNKYNKYKTKLNKYGIYYISNYLIDDFTDLYNNFRFKLPNEINYGIYYITSYSYKAYIKLLMNIVRHIKYKRPDNYTLKYVNCIKYQFINLIFDKFHLPIESIKNYIKFSKFSAQNILDSIIEYLYAITKIDKLNCINIYDIQIVLTYWNIYKIYNNYKNIYYILYNNIINNIHLPIDNFDIIKINNIILHNLNENTSIIINENLKYKYIFEYDFEKLIKKILINKLNIFNDENYYLIYYVLKNVKPSKLTYILFGRSINFIDNNDVFKIIYEPNTKYDIKPYVIKYLCLYLASLL